MIRVLFRFRNESAVPRSGHEVTQPKLRMEANVGILT